MDSTAPAAGDSVIVAALKVLHQTDPIVKAEYTFAAYKLWREGQLTMPTAADAELPVPDRPARADDKVHLVAPGEMPKLGKGGTPASRQAIVHSLAHIENWAIDLSWDIIARFGTAYPMPREFFSDFVQVAEDECRHFSLLNKRLEEMGSHYGALPAHDGLWESASRTAHSLAARLAVEHCVHEARGLDVLPTTIHKFRSNGDEATARLLEGTIYPEEITHCGAGVRWLKWLHAQAASSTGREAGQTGQGVEGAGLALEGHCEEDAVAAATAASSSCNGQDHAHHANGHSNGDIHVAASSSSSSSSHTAKRPAAQDGWRVEAAQYATVQEWFHALIRKNFGGSLKPPFNTKARAEAGFEESWYLPLVATTANVGQPS